MKKLVLAAAMLALLAAAPVWAQGPMGGLGFRTGSGFPAIPATPVDPSPTIGVRHWVNSQVGLDLGVGFNQVKLEPGPRTFTGYVFDIGLPFALKAASDKVNLILRPGFQWGSMEDKDEEFVPASTVKFTSMAVSGEVEVEWMVADKLSLSASHGISWHKLEDDGSPKSTITSLGTFGNNFTTLGFHVYLW